MELYEQVAGRPGDRSALRFWEVLAAVKMSALNHRVSLVLPPGRERDLLVRMEQQLADDLEQRLLES